MKLKKSQITVFIIIGFVVILSFLLLVFLSRISTETKSDPTIIITQGPQLFPIDKYVSYCIEKEVIPVIRNFSRGAGVVGPNSLKTSEGDINFLYSLNEGNFLLSNKMAEEHISRVLKPLLDECIDADEYRRLGYDVEEGEKSVKVTVALNEVIIELDYFLRVSKSNLVSFQDKFRESTSVPLGQFINHARDIVNSELQRNFDLDYFRITNKNLDIVKKSPYPNSIYTIKTRLPKESSRYLEINFAIEDLDKSSLKFSQPEMLLGYFLDEDEGSCYIDRNCYSFTKDNLCQKKEGEFISGGSCDLENRIISQGVLDSIKGISSFQEYVDLAGVYGENCDKYYDAYSGEIVDSNYVSGESWCSYEPGVGGRFYKLSCVQGQVLIEQCSDFKEEVCAQKDLNLDDSTFSVATCRPNRFWSCTTCTTKECCNNAEVRDCVWDERLGCFPFAEPGFRFWNNFESTQICSNAVSLKSFNFGLNQEINAKNCYSVGDCGAKQNYFGFFSQGHSQRTDFKEDFYLDITNKQKEKFSQIPFNIGDYIDQFSPSNLEITSRSSSFGFIEVLNRYLKNIDELMVYDLNTYLDPQFDINIDGISLTTCSPWSPISFSRCDACNIRTNSLDGKNDYSECTEYKCHSLGNECVFERVNGLPHCFNPELDDVPIDIVGINVEDYSISQEETSLGRGVFVESKISLFEPFVLKLDTNKDALCKLSYLPDKSFSELGGLDLTGMEFSNSHSLSITFNHNFDIFDKILDYFEKPNYGSLLDTLIDLRYKLDAFRRRFPLISKFSYGIYPILVPLSDYYLDVRTQDKLELIFNNLDSGNFFIFFKCMDRGGKEAQDFYVRFRLDDPCLDDEPPTIVHTIPQNNGVSTGDINIYVNEISECKFDLVDVDFATMRYEMDCDHNPYSVSGFGNGSYRCRSNLDKYDLFMSDDEVKIYIRCKDNPYFDRIGDIYTFNLKKSIDHDWFNNITYQNYEVLTTNSTELISIDLRELIINEKNGYFDLGISYGSQKYIGLDFNVPMDCFADEEVRCSSSRCVLRNNFNKDEIDVTCKYRVPNCNYFNRNENQDSFEYFLRVRPPLNIISGAYFNDTFIVKYNDGEDARTDCGIQIKSNQGYLQMLKKEDSNEFIYRHRENRVGGGSAEIICVNKYGDVDTQKIDYVFS